MSIGVMPFLFMLYWSCHWIGHIHSTWLPKIAQQRDVLGLGAGICIGAVVEAQHLDNVGIELLYMTYKLTYVDALGLLKYIGDVVLFLLCRVDGKRSEQVKHHTIVKRLARNSPWAF
jgi:hypothetical protein